MVPDLAIPSLMINDGMDASPRLALSRRRIRLGAMRKPPRLEKLDGSWSVFIVIVEDGETTQKRFETKQFAKNFADGQRGRLKPATKMCARNEAGGRMTNPRP
jgi:hypothetical protein